MLGSIAFHQGRNKVGLDLSEAIGVPPNNTLRFASVPHLGVPVRRGPIGDGLGPLLKNQIEESVDDVVDVAAILRETQTEVLISYLPVGSTTATRWYAEQALGAGCAFINCVPVFIASDGQMATVFLPTGACRSSVMTSSRRRRNDRSSRAD
jgi:myo-inositol-1-phosphate synthase